MKATSKKRASWKQILNKVHDFKGNLTEQFPAFKEWLEKDWHCGPKRTAPTARAGAENATLNGQPSTKKRRNEGAPCAQLQPNGGVGDQLGDRLQHIENSQGRLVEVAVAEYIRQNEDSVRAAAVKKYSKANRHDQAFVAEAQRAYAERHHSSIVAAAAAKNMEEHDEDFREEAVDAYIAMHADSEELKDDAAKKYMEEHEGFRWLSPTLFRPQGRGDRL